MEEHLMRGSEESGQLVSDNFLQSFFYIVPFTQTQVNLDLKKI